MDYSTMDAGPKLDALVAERLRDWMRANVDERIGDVLHCPAFSTGYLLALEVAITIGAYDDIGPQPTATDMCRKTLAWMDAKAGQ